MQINKSLQYQKHQNKDQLANRLQLSVQNAQNKKNDLYDVCHHCMRVVPDGQLINHLKNECLPRKRRMIELQKNKDKQQNNSKRIRYNEIENPQLMIMNKNSYKNSLLYVRQKVLSPWVLDMPKQIRQHIKPTYSVIMNDQF